MGTVAPVVEADMILGGGRMPETGRALWLLFRRSWLGILRRPVTLTFSFVQPLVWMAFFGFLFQRFTNAGALGDLDYLSFVAPGVSLMTVLLGASQSGVPLVRDHQTGYLERMLCSARGPVFILAGKLLADGSRLLAQALVVLSLGALLGAELDPCAATMPLALVGVLLLALGLSSLSCVVAAVTREPEPMGTYVHLVNMPLLFTSTALVPQRHMPSGLAQIATHNPLSLVVDYWRAAWLGTESPSATTLLVPALLCASAFALATWTLGRSVRRP
ncbi:MAG: ABC transporter permease [Myxococcota bacterium]